MPQHNENDRATCEGNIGEKDCWEALQSMQNGKSPGNDGLTKEFYICFFNEVSKYLIDALNHSFKIGHLSTSQRYAIITLIEKKRQRQKIYKKLETNFFNKCGRQNFIESNCHENKKGIIQYNTM